MVAIEEKVQAEASLDWLAQAAIGLPDEIAWWCLSVDGGHMERVNLPVFFRFGGALSALGQLKAGDKYMGNLGKIYPAKNWLEHFIQHTSRMAFPLSRAAAGELLETVDGIIKPFEDIVGAETVDLEQFSSQRKA